MAEKIKLEHNDKYVWIRLYDKIYNLDEIKSLIGYQFDGCLIKAELIWDLNHLLIAINKANGQQEMLKTKNVHTEIAYNLNPSKNITDSYKIFGTDGEECKDKAFFAIVVGNDQDKPILFDKIDNQPINLDQLNSYRNTQHINKVYNTGKCGNNDRAIWDLIVSKIASKDII